MPHTADLNLFRSISLTSAVCKVPGAILKEKMSPKALSLTRYYLPFTSMTCPTTCQQTATSMQMTSNSSPHPNRQGIPQSSLNVSASWSKDWELDLDPKKREELSISTSTDKNRRIVFYLKRSFETLTPSTILLLYKIFIRAHLEYAIRGSHLFGMSHMKQLSRFDNSP